MLHFGRNPVLPRAIALLILSPLLGAQQGGIGNLVGEIHLGGGDFAGRIFVELQLRGATLASAYCDDEGKFGFSGLASNPYHVVIQDERFSSIDKLVVVDTSISSLFFVQVTLNVRDSVKNDSLLNRDKANNPYLVDSAEYRRHFPKKAIREFEAGVKAQRNNKIDVAIVHYQNSISVASDFYLARNNLGSIFLLQSRFGEAQVQFEEVIKTRPNDAVAYFNLGNALLFEGQYVPAVHWAGEGLVREPNSSFGHLVMGTLFSKLGKSDAAENELRRSLVIDPLMAKAHLALVNLYIHQNRTDAAVAELKVFLKAFPADAFASKARQMLLGLEGQATHQDVQR